MQTVAMIGLGAMGMPMAKRLLAEGFTVRGYDTRAAATDAFTAAGGYGASSVEDACSGAAITVLMVVNAQQAQAVLFDGGGLAVMPPDAIVVLSATCAPKDVEAIAERVIGDGKRIIDAPVSGGVRGAEAGTLTIMAAGAPASFEAAKRVFAALGDKLFYIGERPGQGAAVKAVNQLLAGVHIAVTAEALTLAEKFGVDLPTVLEILSGSAAQSWMLRDRGPRMLEEDPEVRSSVDIFVKDLGIVLDSGGSRGTALPLAAVARQFFLAASGKGLGGADDSQVIRAYRALNDL